MAHGITHPRLLSPNAQTYQDILSSVQGINFATDMDAVRRRKAEYATYLGQTDYDKQRQESQEMAKLQLGLALASRGFAAMGAQPRPGEMAISTLGREMLAPLGADAMAVAQQLYQQKQQRQQEKRQEERKLKLAALEAVSGEEAGRRALALELMPVPGKDTLNPTVHYVLRQGLDNEWEFVPQTKDEKGRTQVRLQQGTGAPYDIQTQALHPLLPGEIIVTAANVKNYIPDFDPSEDEGVVKDNYVAVFNAPTTYKGKTYTAGQPYLDDEGRRPTLQRISKGPDRGALTIVGDTSGDVFIPPNNTDIKLLSDVDITSTAATDAQRATEDRVGVLYSTMAQIQVGQEEGKFSAYNARAALYFDQSAYLAGDFAFKYIPPGAAFDDRSRDVTITNPNVQALITNKMKYLANTILRADFGGANQTVKTLRIADAVKQMLSIPPSTLFGAAGIENIGTDSGGNVVGYTPDQTALSPAVKAIATATAMDIMKTDPNANAVVTFSPIDIPDNKASLRTAGGRMRIATEVFPSAFSNYGEAGTDLYDLQLVQRRLDVEDVLLDAPLVWDASLTEYRILIQDLASKKAKARDDQQNSTDARLARESFDFALEFRGALLDFKNAAAESGVEGYFTGTSAAVFTRIGFADWLIGDGSEHMSRLAQASTRFQEGISRRIGHDFGDDRISDADAEAYQKMVPDIRSGTYFNRILVEDGLRRVNRDMTDLMAHGGKVEWTERDLEKAAEAGVDFSDLNTQMSWHGYGYYGKSRYSTSRQYTPALSDAKRNDLRTTGELKDSLYAGLYTVPITVDYLTDQSPTFSLGSEATDDADAVPATRTKRMGPPELEYWLKGRAKAANVTVEEMRRRVVRGIRLHYIWRNTLR